MLHGAVALQQRNGLGDLAGPLSDSDVYADQVAALLVDYRIQAEGRLPRGPVADYQLPLPAPHGHHRVDGLHPGLHRDVDLLPGGHAGRYHLYRRVLRRRYGALGVQGLPQGADNPPQHRVAHGYLHHPPGAAHLCALLDALRVAQDNRADAVLLEVQGHAGGAALELQELIGPNARQPVHAGDAVPHLDHHTDVDHPQLLAELFDLALDYRRYVLSSDCH